MINEKILTQIVSLGEIFAEVAKEDKKEKHPYASDVAFLKDQMFKAESENAWFTIEEQKRCFGAWAEALQRNLLAEFCSPISVKTPKKVALICAGNIPMVGFHDALSVLMSGHHLYLKPSSDDKVLILSVLEIIKKLIPEWVARIHVLERIKASDVDALIATGSDNTSRYFEFYFKNLPKIIRKNRISVAVLSGQESDHEIEKLGEDIFAYYGLGCRNVSKVFVPKGFDVQRFFAVMPNYAYLENHHKYMNNYTYNKALYLLNQDKFLENGYFLLRETTELHSPISTLFYEEYSSLSEIDKKLAKHVEKIQCRVGVNGLPIGQAQKPSLLDFADNIDTRAFLSEI